MDLFGIDLRSLAVFRMSVAGVLLYDLIDRSRDVVAHYTDLGVLPARSVPWVVDHARILLLSPHYQLSGSVAGEVMLFLLAGLAALALLLGYWTRLATLVSWFLLSSIQVRNPYVASMGGDMFLRVLLFWGIFLPLGARWSLDARRNPLPGSPSSVFSVASAALLIQVFLMYFATGMSKNGATWLEGRAVYYALHIDYYATPVGIWLRQYDQLTTLFTHGTRWFEILGPFLAFMPVHTGPFRVLAIALFIGFHASLAACLWIGPFPVISLAGWMAFIPAWFWDRLLPRLRRVRAGPAAALSSPTRPGPVLGTPRAIQAFVAVLLVWSVTDVASKSGFFPREALPRSFASIAGAFGIRQQWSMFAPDPPPQDAWLVVDGTLANDRRWDPLRDGPVSWTRPESLPNTFPTFRWRLYLLKLIEGAGDVVYGRMTFEVFSQYLCRDWNARHSTNERLQLMQIFVLIERTDAPPGAPPDRLPANKHSCRDESHPRAAQGRSWAGSPIPPPRQRPLKIGGRFSRNARTASRWSSLPADWTMPSASWARQASSSSRGARSRLVFIRP